MMLLHCALARANHHSSRLSVPDFGHLHFRCTCHRQGRCHTSFGPGWVGIAECSEDISVRKLGELSQHKWFGAWTLGRPFHLSCHWEMLHAPFLTWVVVRCPVGHHLLGTLKTTSRALHEVDASTRQPVWNSSFVSSNPEPGVRFGRFSECFCCVAFVFRVCREGGARVTHRQTLNDPTCGSNESDKEQRSPR